MPFIISTEVAYGCQLAGRFVMPGSFLQVHIWAWAVIVSAASAATSSNGFDVFISAYFFFANEYAPVVGKPCTDEVIYRGRRGAG